MKTESMLNQSWWHLSSIQVGGAICLPVLMLGQMLASTYGLSASLVSIIVGNTLLCAFGLLKAKMSFENKNITIENATRYFGPFGKQLLALNMIISLTGWFAIQLNLLSISVKECLALVGYHGAAPALLLNIVLGILMTLGALKGIHALEKLSSLTMPLLIFVMVYGVFQSIQHGMPPLVTPGFSLKGISMVLATALLAIIDIPTYYRFSRSLRDSTLSVIFSYGLVLPLIEIAGVLISQGNQAVTIIDALSARAGPSYKVAVLLFLVFAGWTTNNANIYSAAVTLKNMTRLSEFWCALIVGLLGTLLSCFNMLSHFEPMINSMAIVTSAMGAVIAISYLLTRGKCSRKVSVIGNFGAWLIGTVCGFLSLWGYLSLTHVEVLDTFLITGGATMMLTLLFGDNNEII